MYDVVGYTYGPPQPSPARRSSGGARPNSVPRQNYEKLQANLNRALQYTETLTQRITQLQRQANQQGNSMQTIQQLESQVTELEAELQKLRRSGSSGDYKSPSPSLPASVAVSDDEENSQANQSNRNFRSFIKTLGTPTPAPLNDATYAKLKSTLDTVFTTGGTLRIKERTPYIDELVKNEAVLKGIQRFPELYKSTYQKYLRQKK